MSAVVAYEDKLTADPYWALEEGGMHFEGGNSVHAALRRVTAKLDELGVPYALVGGMAMFLHGYRRFTDDVDLLVTREGLKVAHANMVGLGWVTPFAGSKNLRDAVTGVKVEFLVTGGYPGDGLPKPVSFPDPADVAVEIGHIKCVSLPTLVQLKLASGTAEQREKDLVDVTELIKTLSLPESFGDQLDPSVRTSFADRWRRANLPPLPND